MDLVQYAVPFFILAMLLEYLFGRWRHKQTYRLSDTLNSLSLGVISQLVNVLRLGFASIVFAAVVEKLGVNSWSMGSVWQWVAAFVLYDLCYYWKHRYGHEWRIFWASHVAHHQSEEFNLSTALRQTGTDYLGFVFYIPLFVIGIPAEVVITVGSLNLIYQFWVHTEHVSELGFIEWIFVTPSNHRVHHARNPMYLDKNYGGVFIIWDRLFGTYQKELKEEPCVYGITTGLHSWNPVWANVHVWWETIKISVQTKRWRDKLLVWFRSPGWLPNDIQQPPAVDYRAEKYQTAMLSWLKPYLFLHFWVVTAFSIALQQLPAPMPRMMELVCFGWLILSLLTFGVALEGRLTAIRWETLRLLTGTGLSLWLFMHWQPMPNAFWLTLLIALVSAVYIWFPRKAVQPRHST